MIDRRPYESIDCGTKAFCIALDVVGVNSHLLRHVLEPAQGLHVGADGEQDGLCLGESAQRLPLHPCAES